MVLAATRRKQHDPHKMPSGSCSDGSHILRSISSAVVAKPWAVLAAISRNNTTITRRRAVLVAEVVEYRTDFWKTLNDRRTTAWTGGGRVGQRRLRGDFNLVGDFIHVANPSDICMKIFSFIDLWTKVRRLRPMFMVR